MSDKKAKAKSKEAPEVAKAPRVRKARAGQSHSPAAMKRARWLADLFNAKQPQHPRLEVKVVNGKQVVKELPPQPRATRAEFLAPAPLSYSHPPFSMG